MSKFSWQNFSFSSEHKIKVHLKISDALESMEYTRFSSAFSSQTVWLDISDRKQHHEEGWIEKGLSEVLPQRTSHRAVWRRAWEGHSQGGKGEAGLALY